jgi:hypothetical protein
LIQGDHIIILALYVDDMLLTGSSTALIMSTKKLLEENFEMSDIGDGTVAMYLKAECINLPTGIFMTQRGYCRQILELFSMLDAHAVSTPMVERPRLLTDMQEDLVDPTLYRSMVGKLLHLNHTRPDITYSVSIVSHFMSRPQVSHLQAVKRIFRYLSGTWDFGVLFGRGSAPVVTGFSDSDYAGDIETGKSTTGFVFRLGNSPITWYSKKQPTVALSSTEAEYRAFSKAARETVWLRILMSDLGEPFQDPIMLFCDN